MSMEVTQRWRKRRDSYRPAGEVINPSVYEVAALGGDMVARKFVEDHHYSGSFPAARFKFGLFRNHELVGACIYSVPAGPKVLSMFPGDPLESCELGRLVLLDSEPANAESWFVARTFRELRREGIHGVISFSDPVPRKRADGTIVFPGHLGIVYQSLSARYLNRATPRTLRLLPDGTVFSDRAQSKLRKRDRGWRYASSILVRHGADRLHDEEDSAEWMAYWVGRITRPLRHLGNHRYVWGLTPQVSKFLPEGRPYPKNFTSFEAMTAKKQILASCEIPEQVRIWTEEAEKAA